MPAPLLGQFVKRDFVDRFSGSVLGASWLLIGPLVQILIFTLIFGKLIGPRIPGTSSTYAYGLYLVSGLLPWVAFANTIGRTTGIFLEKSGILTKVPVRLSVIAVHVAIAEAITLACVLLLFIGVMTAVGAPPSWLALYVPLLIVFQQAMAFTIGLVAAMLTLFVRDVRELVGVILFVWFWSTPVVYLAGDVHPALHAAQAFNPAFWFVEEYHRVLVYGQPPDLIGLLPKLVAVAAGACGLLWLLAHWERDIRDIL